MWHKRTDFRRFQHSRSRGYAVIMSASFGLLEIVRKEPKTMDASAIDQTKLESLLMRAVGDLSAGYGRVMVGLGNRARSLQGHGRCRPDRLKGTRGTRGLRGTLRKGVVERTGRRWLRWLSAKPADIPVEQPTKFDLVMQPEDREDAWAHHSAVGAGARGRGDSVAERFELIAVECPVLVRRNGRSGSCTVLGDWVLSAN